MAAFPSGLAQYFCLVAIIISFVSAIDIGTNLDYQPELGITESVNSYSAVIEFTDKTIPGDITKMSDAKFINLAKVAYDDMVEIFNIEQLPTNALPGAMMAFESEGRIYFASSVKARNNVDLDIANKDKVNSIGWYQANCQMEFGTHRAAGKCAEPNALRLYGDLNGLDNEGSYKTPPTSETSPRMAVWGRKSWQRPGTNSETFKAPCESDEYGWGCEKFVAQFGLKVVEAGVPDATGQDDWQFTQVENPRHSCYETGTGTGTVETQSIEDMTDRSQNITEVPAARRRLFKA